MALTEEAIEKNYHKFKKFLKGYVSRDGVDKLIEWLDTTDMKIAPASTKYHGAYAGGLVEHCLDTFTRMFTLMKFDYNDEIPYDKESIAIVSLLHDLDKVNKYELSMRNVKDENGQWTQVPFYAYKQTFDKLVFGTHAENSMFIADSFLHLNYEEKMAILAHMGGANYEEKDVARVEIDCHRISALAYYLHEADYYSTCRLEYARPSTEDYLKQFPYIFNDETADETEAQNEEENETELEFVQPEE